MAAVLVRYGIAATRSVVSHSGSGDGGDAVPGMHGALAGTAEGVKSPVPAGGIGAMLMSSASVDDIGVVVGVSAGLMASHRPSPSVSTTSACEVSLRIS